MALGATLAIKSVKRLILPSSRLVPEREDLQAPNVDTRRLYLLWADIKLVVDDLEFGGNRCRVGVGCSDDRLQSSTG